MLDQQNSNMSKLAQLAAQDLMLSNLAGIGSGNPANSLKTEVRILESPSVLKPVYDYVLEEKIKAGENIDGYTFSDWLPNLKVALEKEHLSSTSHTKITTRILFYPLWKGFPQLINHILGVMI